MHRPFWRYTLRPVSAAVLAVGIAYLSAGCAPEGEGTQHRYVERLGSDTMSIEAYTRTESGFDGDVVIRVPVTRVAHYEADLTPEGTISRMDVEWRTPPENPAGEPARGFTVTIEGDSATVARRGPDADTTRIAVPRGTIPLVGKLPMAYAVLEQAVRQALASGADSVPIDFLSADRGLESNVIVRTAPDSISIGFFGSPLVARISADGEVIGRSGEQTTLKVTGERVETLDVASLAADFAARDARGEGIGPASPGATVEASIDGANLTVKYSQPAKRGREIWGGLVPYEEVWRTGANAATMFTTDRDLQIGGVPVPAGSYTLFSIYTPESAQLIINQQTGQWGTVYDPERDLVRVDMTRSALPEPMERFTIAIEPAAQGGTLQLMWDQTRFSVPIAVR